MNETNAANAEVSQADSSLAGVSVEAGKPKLPPAIGSEGLIPPPTRRMMMMVQWFRIGLSLFLILSALLGLMGCSSQAATTPWRSATDVLPRELLLDIVKQQSTNVPNPERVVNDSLRVFIIPGREGRVAIFNFDHSNWCGSGGCYFPAYWLREGNVPSQFVFSQLLYPRLPSGRPLFEKGEDNGQAIPCLSVWQSENIEMTRLRQTTYCFNGTQYQPARSNVFDSRQASK
ncbi:hypothetical protein ACQ4M3_07530 [Leptolyngbya sp. AN03gr2]|uniref:hypothetical protein n=1 Tax=unclassified Leptolyngbya TaxID=2650499 RepID=UPI003D316A26